MAARRNRARSPRKQKRLLASLPAVYDSVVADQHDHEFDTDSVEARSENSVRENIVKPEVDEIEARLERKRELWENFKEEHYEAIEQLPLYLHRTYRLIRDLDKQANEHQAEILCLLKEYYALRRQLVSTSSLHQLEGKHPVGAPLGEQTVGSEDQKTQHVKEQAVALAGNALQNQQPPNAEKNYISSDVGIDASLEDALARASAASKARFLIGRIAVLLDQWVHAGDEKMNIVGQTDRHVRILDLSIAEQAKNASEIPPNINLSAEAGPLDNGAETDAEVTVNISDNAFSRSTTRRSFTSRAVNKGKQAPPPPADSPSRAVTRVYPTRNAIDMAVLPDEPFYCYCQQVSHGKVQMIACDNKGCQREWFHYDCIGLKEEPTTDKEWFCPDCSETIGPTTRNTRRRR